MKDLRLIRVIGVCLVSSMFLSGCALIFQKGRRSDIEKIESLEQELSDLRQAKSLLEDKLSREIGDSRVKLEMKDKGLVITVLNEVLFDSGKAELKKESYEILDKVISILNSELKQHEIGVEGHTDNQPIKLSNWKSNWDLSANRALSVLEYLESKGVESVRLSGLFYSEFKPVASNDTKQGKQLNRRVEIVVLPQIIKKTDKVESEEPSEEILK
jgi:chemotaxis protein MotB